MRGIDDQWEELMTNEITWWPIKRLDDQKKGFDKLLPTGNGDRIYRPLLVLFYLTIDNSIVLLDWLIEKRDLRENAR